MGFENIEINHFLIVSSLLFTIGVFGVFYNRKNLVTMFLSIELLLLATQINLVAFSTYWGDISGQILALLVLIVAVAEIVIGISIFIALFRVKKTIDVTEINILKG